MEVINYTHDSNLHNPKDALEILPIIFEIVKPKSIIDIGCGNGSWLNAAKSLGVTNVQGVDGIQVEVEELLIEKKEFLKHDLSKSLNLKKTYDLAISLEVAEHLTETAAETIIETLCTHSGVVLFSAAIPDQGGDHHYNEQWPDYWQSIFKKQDYLAFDIIRPKIWNNKKIFWWYKQNTILYVHKEHKLIESLGEGVPKVQSLVHPQLYNRKIHKPNNLSKKDLFKLWKQTTKLVFKGN